MRQFSLHRIALAGVLIFFARSVPAVSYSFSDIADSNTLGSVSSFGSPILNLDGQLCFSVLRTNSTRQIMVGSGLGVSTVVGTGSFYSGAGGTGTMSSMSPDPGMNNAGVVSWHSVINNFAKGESIFVNEAGTTTEISHAAFPGQFAAYDNHTSINSGGAGGGTLTGGRVAFMGQQNDGTLGLYKASNGSPAQTIVSGPSDNYLTWQICSFGTTAFTGTKGGVTGVFTGIAGGSPSTIATGAFSSASINDNAVIAFNSSSTIFTRTIGGGGSVAFVGTGSSGFTSFNSMGGGVINNAGSIVFLAQNTSTSAASLFGGPTAASDRVIGTGSSLFGSTVTSIGGYSQNDNGQIAFDVTLASGAQAIVLATPVVTAVSGFNNSISTNQNLQKDLGFTVGSTKGKAQIMGDPATPSNGVIDYVDYEGSSVSTVKNVAATQSFIHVDLDYRFLSAGSFDILLNGVTLQTITAGASGSYTHLSNNYTLASFGLSPGNMDLAVRLDSGADTRELLVDNFNFSAPEPSCLSLVATSTLLLLRRRGGGLIAYNALDGNGRNR